MAEDRDQVGQNLPYLHDAIQAAFLWNDMHLWGFEISNRKHQEKGRVLVLTT